MGWVAVMNRMIDARRTAAAGDVEKSRNTSDKPDRSRKPH
jgi:hypothetical protein